MGKGSASRPIPTRHPRRRRPNGPVPRLRQLRLDKRHRRRRGRRLRTPLAPRHVHHAQPHHPSLARRSPVSSLPRPVADDPNGRLYLLEVKWHAAAKGMIRRGRRMIVATDGRPPKSRRRLLIYFTAGEFRGIENFGPRHIWEISVTIDKKKGLCCRRADPGNPGSPWDVPPDVAG